MKYLNYLWLVPLTIAFIGTYISLTVYAIEEQNKKIKYNHEKWCFTQGWVLGHLIIILIICTTIGIIKIIPPKTNQYNSELKKNIMINQSSDTLDTKESKQKN